RVDIQRAGQGDFDGWIFGAENVRQRAGRVLLRVADGALLDGIDQPDPFHSDGKILGDFWLHAGDAVFGREKWRNGGASVTDVMVTPHRHVGDAVAGGTDSNRNFENYPKPNRDRRLLSR